MMRFFIRKTLRSVCFSFFLVVAAQVEATPATWEPGEEIPETGRPNPLGLGAPEWDAYRGAGYKHALVYPVQVTGALIPYEPTRRFLDDPSPNPIRALLQELSKSFSKIESFAAAMRWLGLHPYPLDAGTNGSKFPLPEGFRVGDPMGLTVMNLGGVPGATFSCAACHVGQLFGRPILGLTNRFPRANVAFVGGKLLAEGVTPLAFSLATGASGAETRLYRRTRDNLNFVGSKRPEVLGLDTSLAHVALSLARREPDEVASKTLFASLFPRTERLESFPADSKPAVWWGVKYKNRWLSDGSVVAGNPIFTNLLWNEIGRGTDLEELREWLATNQRVVAELTTAVFSSEPPPITDFFPADRIDLAAAKRGEAVFKRRCARCHGDYEKTWSLPGAVDLPLREQLKTYRVRYFSDTPIEDVGTDPHRYEGIRSLEQLNRLKISRENGIKIETSEGYVPPPLVGIWARWPYLHNNSVPSLCALLSPEDERPERYWAGEPLSPDLDFDFDCNGYPVGDATPVSWQKDTAYLYDTRRLGMSRKGHSVGIVVSKRGERLISEEDRRDLIRFLQTL